jgi:serine kinase of HPr protein (carbohydrate metabolism regulator)
MNQPTTTQIHASCVEFAGTGVLLRGPSGSGKSDLALRLIEAGGCLVADDRTDLTVEAGSLLASSPASIAGRLEVRGVGIVMLPAVARARVGLAVDLVPAGQVERMPGAARCSYLGIELPLIALAPFECSATAKLRVAAREAAGGRLSAA